MAERGSAKDFHIEYSHPEEHEDTSSTFPPVVLDSYPDGRAKRGILGRDDKRKIVYPEGVTRVLPDGLTQTDIIKYELSAAEALAAQTAGHLPPNVSRWFGFRNPSQQEIDESDAWEDTYDPQ